MYIANTMRRLFNSSGEELWGELGRNETTKATRLVKRSSVYWEFAMVLVDVPSTYTQQYGVRQQGAFIDVVQPVLSREIRFLRSKKATLNLAMRFDYVDWNVGTFNETGTEIGDQVFAITPGISFRPWNQTVLRLNYRYQWQTDIIGNPPALASSWLFGLSTYF